MGGRGQPGFPEKRRPSAISINLERKEGREMKIAIAHRGFLSPKWGERMAFRLQTGTVGLQEIWSLLGVK